MKIKRKLYVLALAFIVINITITTAGYWYWNTVKTGTWIDGMGADEDDDTSFWGGYGYAEMSPHSHPKN